MFIDLFTLESFLVGSFLLNQYTQRLHLEYLLIIIVGKFELNSH